MNKLEIQTLAELKAENAALENQETQPAGDGQEEENLETEVEETEEIIDQDDTEESQEGTEDSDSSEAWMEGDEQGEPGSDSNVVPVSAHASMRSKLKGKIHEQKSEIDELKEKIAKLESLSTQPGTSVSTSPQASQKPKLMDYDSDEEYENALDAWYESKIEQKLTRFEEGRREKSRESEAAKAIDTAVDDHYTRAAKLAETNKISPDVYRKADEDFRRIFDEAYPGRGDVLADQVIARLGPGSEKVAFFIGRNATAKKELSDSLKSDPSGLSAAILVGQKMAMVNSRSRKTSNAPAPADSASGDTVAGTSERRLKSAYDKAHKANDSQKAYNLRKQARAKGVNVSNW